MSMHTYKFELDSTALLPLVGQKSEDLHPLLINDL